MHHTIYMKEGCVKVNYKPETRVIYVLWKDIYDQKIVRDCLFPGYAKAGLYALITIDSEIPVTRLSAKRWTQTGADFNFDVLIVKSKEEASKAAVEYLQARNKV